MFLNRKNILLLSILVVLGLTTYQYYSSIKRAIFGRSVTGPNIIVVLIDTLRSDHLSYNGYPRLTSPNIDALAKESTNFNYAYSGSSWTAPSVATLFTGVYPSVHGMMPPNARVKAAEKFSFKLGSDLQTLAEVLKQQGYSTYGISSNEWISDKFGFTQGFDYFFVESRMNGDQVNRKSFRVIDKIADKGDPFFLYLHYFDPHDPYKAPKPFDNHFKEELEDPRYEPKIRKIIRSYDNEIFYVDKKIGELFRHLKSKNLYNDSIIILTSDHGEQFGERGHVGHGYNLYNEEVRIPLLVRIPGKTDGKTNSTPVSHIDVYRTLTELAGSNTANANMGISLLSQDLTKRPIEIISEVTRHYSSKAVIRSNHRKIIGEYDVAQGLYTPVGQETAIKIYDMLKDPLEMSIIDGNEGDKESLACYSQVLNKVSTEFPKFKVDTLEMSEDTLKELKTLGYL